MVDFRHRLRLPPPTTVRFLLAATILAFAGGAGASDACLDCHGDADNVGDTALAVDAGRWEATIHGAAGISCLDCHAGKEDYPHEAGEPRASCVECHSDAVEALARSVHGRPDRGAARHPDCTACHGQVHTMYGGSDPASPVHETRLAATCGTCHSDPDLVSETGVKLVQPIAAYAASVHARRIAEGTHAATCSSCHGTHDILAGDDPASPVHPRNVPQTCAHCHGEVAATFARSVHGQAAARGIRESPVCTDCHGEHRILGPADRGSPVFASNVPKMTCGRCHGDLRVTEKFAMSATAVTAFEDSFHGLASRSGSVTVANCASCHGVHDILPSSNPASHIHPDNLAATCGSCHPGAGRTFAIGAVHVLPSDRELSHPVVYWLRIAYLWMIWIVIGGMLLHNALDLRRKVLSPIERPVVPVEERRERMLPGFRIAHATLMVSFLVLVWTGFALKYAETWWARPLLTWEAQFGLRGWLHRGAAIVMLAAFAFHAVHLAVNRRARACIRGMMPSRHDLHELGERIRWFLGRRGDAPSAGARLRGEGRVPGAGLGHGDYGGHRVRALVLGLVARLPAQVGERRGDGRALLRGGARQPGDPRLASLLRDLRPARLPDGHRLDHRTRGPWAHARAHRVDDRARARTGREI
jgi:hypothetical protein